MLRHKLRYPTFYDFHFQNNFPYVIRKTKDKVYKNQNSFGKRNIKNSDIQAGAKHMNMSPSSDFTTHRRKESVIEEDIYEGLFIDILNNLAKDLKFNYVLRTDSRHYGSLDNISGNWSGIIGQLVERVNIIRKLLHYSV